MSLAAERLLPLNTTWLDFRRASALSEELRPYVQIPSIMFWACLSDEGLGSLIAIVMFSLRQSFVSFDRSISGFQPTFIA